MKRRVAALAAFILMGAAQPQETATADQLYRQGVEARHAGNTERAVELLGRVAQLRPEDADVQLQLGLALMAAGRHEAAEAALRRTLELAPAYADARTALDRLAAQRSGASGAAPLPWQVDLDASYSALEGASQPDWRELSLRVRRDLNHRTALAATVEVAERFGRTDTYGELRLDQRLSEGSSFYLSAGGTPDADFRPRWQLGAGAAVRVRSGPSATVLTVDARHARYRAGDIQTIVPGVEQYVAGGRAWLTGRWINIFDENGRHHSGWLARGDLMASDRLRLFAGVADAPDVSEGVVTETFSLFGGASLDVSRRTTLRLSIAHEDRARGSDRLQLAVGLGLRF